MEHTNASLYALSKRLKKDNLKFAARAFLCACIDAIDGGWLGCGPGFDGEAQAEETTIIKDV